MPPSRRRLCQKSTGQQSGLLSVNIFAGESSAKIGTYGSWSATLKNSKSGKKETQSVFQGWYGCMAKSARRHGCKNIRSLAQTACKRNSSWAARHGRTTATQFALIQQDRESGPVWLEFTAKCRIVVVDIYSPRRFIDEFTAKCWILGVVDIFIPHAALLTTLKVGRYAC